MGEVVPFRKPEETEEHLSGEAKCLGCGEEWVAVAPIGVWQLECPKCGTMKGIFKLFVGADDDDLAYTCDCGGEALTAFYHKGQFQLRCMCCGIDCTESVLS
jgi:hypothetical protein